MRKLLYKLSLVNSHQLSCNSCSRFYQDMRVEKTLIQTLACQLSLTLMQLLFSFDQDKRLDITLIQTLAYQFSLLRSPLIPWQCVLRSIFEFLINFPLKFGTLQCLHIKGRDLLYKQCFRVRLKEPVSTVITIASQGFNTTTFPHPIYFLLK